MIYLLILLILVIIIILAFIIPIHTLIFAENNEIEIKLILFRVIKINIKEKTTVEKMKKNKVFKRKIPLKVLIKIAKKLMPYLKRTAEKTKLKLEINIAFGLSSADRTAIVCGLINMFIYNLTNIFDIFLKRFSPSYNIIPDFVNERFDYKIKADISIKMFSLLVFSIHALKILLKYKKYLLKKGGAHNGRTSHRRFNENYNG
jgi:hypothetical protein